MRYCLVPGCRLVGTWLGPSLALGRAFLGMGVAPRAGAPVAAARDDHQGGPAVVGQFRDGGLRGELGAVFLLAVDFLVFPHAAGQLEACSEALKKSGMAFGETGWHQHGEGPAYDLLRRVAEDTLRSAIEVHDAL